jgi:hypothetical protein
MQSASYHIIGGVVQALNDARSICKVTALRMASHRMRSMHSHC